MFTGIVQEIGTVSRIGRRTDGVVRLTVGAPQTARQVGRLESVAVNGVCLSVVSAARSTLSFDLIRETQQLTTLGGLRAGDRVNLEPSLLPTDRLSGHVVFGHIDGVGTLIRRRQLPGELICAIRTPPALHAYLVPKGPVTVDGVSLTVGRSPGRSTFTVHLIPETLRQTTLGIRQAGDRVNVEIDYFAKLIQQFLRRR